ncbi:tetrahydromethanopterin S-methyltransferase subunit G [Sedimentibacter acidaminivorans]|uniref:Tetrahydromethanopterin S-methyltransferase subunit G n=1 Tax=Sedimentibacter acidaminivorans TaxID=913099 RepID=A0ABS4GHJ1_9FIRM|nr:phage tail protein [Sedimentibacter acidaminivorans]MBP1926850.1 tetrahydromethanopterin S-methyltransferase subunit G [Sedimentibacter acidaminivorans]
MAKFENNSVYVDTKSFDRLKIELGNLEKQIPNATVSALNRTLKFTKTNTDKLVREEYAVKSGRVKETLKIHKASKKKLNAYIESKGSTLTLASFPHNPKSPGTRRKTVKVKIKKNEGYKSITPRINPLNGKELKPFVQTANNATLIWHRTGNKARRNEIKRIAHKKITGKSQKRNYKEMIPYRTLSIPQMISSHDTMEKIHKMAKEKLEERLEHEIKYRIDKASKAVKK